MKKLFYLLSVPLFLVGASTAFAAAYLPAVGGTGNATTPSKGDMLVGSSSAIYARVPVGTNGQCWTASSTATYGVSWETCTSASSTATTTINNAPGPVFNFVGNGITIATTTSGGSSTVSFTAGGAGATTTIAIGAVTSNGPNFTFQASTTGSNFNVTSTGNGTITFNCPNATSTVTGCLTSADWAVFNNKLSSAIQTLGGLSTSTITISTTTAANSFNITTVSGNQIRITIPSNLAFFTNDAGFLVNTLNLADVSASTTARTNLGIKATSSLALADANAIQTSYLGSACAAGSMATGVSATGTVACQTTSTVLSGYSTSTGGNPTATIGSSSSNGTANTFLRSDAAPALNITGVSAGSYTNSNITVDANGRLTAAANGSAGSGSGNVNVTAANTIAGHVPYITTTASSTISATSSLTISAAGLVNASSGLTVSGNTTLGSLGGMLKATNGLVSAATSSACWPMLNNFTAPDNSGSVFQEPLSILATNDTWPTYIYRLSTTTITQETAKLYIYGQFTVPLDYVGTSTFAFQWTAASTTGSSTLGFDYRTVTSTNSVDQTGLTQTVTSTISNPSAVFGRVTTNLLPTASNFSAGDMVQFGFFRDGTNASDTANGATILMDMNFCYQK